MTTPQEPKVPLEKPGSGGAGTKTDTGAAAAATGPADGGAKGGVKPQDDDRPPQN
jgi:hypothetical protein